MSAGLGICPNIPSYEEFVRMVEEEASKGNEEAKKLMKRIKKDKVMIEIILKFLSQF